MKKIRAGATARRVIAAASLIGVGVLVGAVTSSLAAPRYSIISTCVDRKTGDMRYLSRGSCKRTELTISWNVQGPSGPMGAEGQQGLQGPRGPAGEDGRVGSVGATGPIGPAGPAGSDATSLGANLNTVRSGTGAPNASLGGDGDFYIDTSSNKLHGPKSAGNWPAGLSLVGPAGAPGTNGINGTNGVNGTDGVDGIDGTNGINGTNGANGAPGATLLGSSFYLVSHYQMNGWHNASCTAGDVATGGGSSPMGANYPITNASGVPTSWTSEQDNVYVVCLDLP